DVVADGDRLRPVRGQVRQRAGDRLRVRVAVGAGVVAGGDRVDDQARVDRVVQAQVVGVGDAAVVDRDGEGARGAAGGDARVGEVLRDREVDVLGDRDRVGARVRAGLVGLRRRAIADARVAVGRRGDVVADGDRLRPVRGQVRQRAGDHLRVRVAVGAGVVAGGDRVDDQARVDRVVQAQVVGVGDAAVVDRDGEGARGAAGGDARVGEVLRDREVDVL